MVFKNFQIGHASKKYLGLAVGCALWTSFGAQSHAQINQQAVIQSVNPVTMNSFDRFAPKPETRNTKLDYKVWDAALGSIVLRLGESIRQRARRPVATVGRRLVGGHKTAYRLEGSRVSFSYMDKEFKRDLTTYREDLVRLANTLDLTNFSRDEQLAFWFNLHNVLVIETISKNYPTKKPSKLLIGTDKQPFHDAKLITINGIPLSLRDIRENIVYRNWNDPKVIYGFFYGDIGGPALQNYAITSDNLNFVLRTQAHEFINSLRGFHKESKTLHVSKIYEDVRPYFFKNWPDDLRQHLEEYATPDVQEELKQDKPFAIDRFDYIIADLVGGSMPMPSSVSISTDDIYPSIKISPEVARLIRELQEKAATMRRRGMINNRSYVIIEDIETIDIDEVYDENEEGSRATPKPNN